MNYRGSDNLSQHSLAKLDYAVQTRLDPDERDHHACGSCGLVGITSHDFEKAATGASVDAVTDYETHPDDG
ncbi:hypothetical protein [Natrinema sp. 74]|uniref:DUF7558 family protein n=1 Tax=Natrinema sp. 74 TaxID=3384159 RepID=UPI0038D3A7D8